MDTIQRALVGFTWLFAVIFLPIETYLSFWGAGFSLSAFSGYAVNVVGVGIALWGVVSLRRDRAYAFGVIAAGWGWTAATFWRGTNLRYWLAFQGAQLSFGEFELWAAPGVTALVATAFVTALAVLVDRSSR